MRSATATPIPPPIRMPNRISRYAQPPKPWCNNVATTAMAMPIMPKRLPSRDVTGEVKLADIGVALLLLLEHREHALGYDEAAKDVDRCQCHRNETEHHRPIGCRQAGCQHGAHDNHR